MRPTSIVTLHYISEAGGFEGTPALSPKIRTAGRKGTSGIKPLIDPSVMGSGAPGEFVTKTVEYASEGPRTAFGLAGKLTGVGGGNALLTTTATQMAAKQLANVMKRYEKETQAQQEGVRNMTNVSNFYQNLGRATIPLHDTDEMGLLKTIFKKYTEGLGGGIIGTMKS